MAKAKQRLKLDLESLFPGTTIKIQENVIDIRPLGVEQIAVVSRKLKGFVELLTEDGVTLDNYNTPDNILKIAVVLFNQFPDVLAEAANIHVEDLKLLPIDVVVDILDKVLDVNMKSKDKLVGNSKSLANKFNLLTEETPKQKSPKQSKS